MKTKIVNCRKEKYDIYIGRPSTFGNPFTIGRDGDRKKVINLFSSYFYNRLDYDIDFKIKIKELRGKTLGCYCKPLACHGDIIAEYLNKNE
jgi:hypothetical protein